MLGKNLLKGISLIEVLIALVVLSIGFFALAAIHAKTQTIQLEAYQRAQATVLLKDMSDRIRVNHGQIAAYTGAGTLGTGDTWTAPCNDPDISKRDLCEWSMALKGAAEKSDGANIGGMIGARGCIEEIQAYNDADGICQPGMYRVTVAWQGLDGIKAPTLECGKDEYGDEEFRRVLASSISVGTPGCSD